MAQLNGDVSNAYNNSTMPEASDSSDSPSLPSLSLHRHLLAPQTQTSSITDLNLSGTCGSMTNLVTGTQLMTIREYDTKLNELKRENFQLKLRIYLIEKEKTGVTRPECESAITRELLKREKTIKAYQKIVQEKDNNTQEIKKHYESLVNERNSEIESLSNERETLTNELTETSSVCRLLMSHLNEFVEFWKRYIPFDPNDTNNAIVSLLNSSEDLLNSASILISHDGNTCNDSIIRRSILGGNNSRVGFSATGVSSLGLLSDISEIIEKSHSSEANEQRYVPLEEKSIQTDLISTVIDDAICVYNEIMNKNVVQNSTQTDNQNIELESVETQTIAKDINDCAIQTTHSMGSRSVTKDDNDTLLKQMENMRLSKEKLEKAITKQLIKTDKLLKKAKTNLKENVK